MTAIQRGIRNVLRNPGRTLIVVVMVGFSLGIFSIMTVVNDTVAENTQTISDEVEATITVRPAGSFGFQSTETIDEITYQLVLNSPNVDTVQVQAQTMTEDTQASGPGGRPGRVVVYGVIPGLRVIVQGGGTLEFESGRDHVTSDVNTTNVVVGTVYASNRDLSVGNTVDVNGTTGTVVGIFSKGTRFGDNAVIMPYDAYSDAFNMEGYQTLYVEPTSLGKKEAAIDSIKERIGEDYDVVGLAETQGAYVDDSLDSIMASSQLGAGIALFTGMVVISFIMVLITRERIKEIGLLKAIGFRNGVIVKQFLTESMVMAAIGFIVSLVVVAAMGTSVAAALVGSAAPTTSSTSGFQRPGGGGGMRAPPAGVFIQDISVALTPGMLAFGLMIALIFGVIGSAYPITRALRLNPSEALRYE